MTQHLGDFAEDSTVDFKWSTNGADGASITRATNGTVSVYIGNGTTQLTAGVTDTEDFDSVTGVHHCRIDLSADGAYAAGVECQVVLSAATIDGAVVNAVLASFSIERAGGVLAVLKGLLESSSDGNIFKAVSLQNADVTVRSSVGLAAANLDTQLAALQTDTNDLQNRLPAALVSGRMDSNVSAMAAGVMTAAAAAPDLTTELQTGLATAAALSTMQGDVTDILADTAVIGAPAGATISADIAAVKVDTADIRVTTDKLDNTLENTSDGYIFTVNGLQNGPSGSGASPSAIADEVQTRTIAAVTVVNALAANSITAAATATDFGAELGAAVWATATRTLTALDEDSTTIDLDAAIRASLGLASANLDTQLADKTGYRLSATGVDDILDEVVEGAVTLRQSVRLANSALGGKASGLETTEATFRDLADTKDRIVATVDVDGNRSAVTRDLT